MERAHWRARGKQVAVWGGRVVAAGGRGTPARCSGSRSPHWAGGRGQA
jgi:hypothetical protein